MTEECESDDALHRLSDILLRRYLVRDLLWCGICDVPWVPILLRPMSRYYVCSKKACSRPAMPANLVEQRVWSRFTRSHGSIAQGVPRDRRHDVLRQELRRAVVSGGMLLRLEWEEYTPASHPLAALNGSEARRTRGPATRLP
jgi:hypothetical protein